MLLFMAYISSSAAHFSRFEFFAKSEKNGTVFREKCEKLRKKVLFYLYRLICIEMTPFLSDNWTSKAASKGPNQNTQMKIWIMECIAIMHVYFEKSVRLNTLPPKDNLKKEITFKLFLHLFKQTIYMWNQSQKGYNVSSWFHVIFIITKERSFANWIFFVKSISQ